LTENIQVLTTIKLAPDGSNTPALLQTLMFYQEISSGARSALPMGVAPEAIVEKDFFEYRLKI
jgi:hypothetical protein